MLFVVLIFSISLMVAVGNGEGIDGSEGPPFRPKSE
jgi:hypothetical protein